MFISGGANSTDKKRNMETLRPNWRMASICLVVLSLRVAVNECKDDFYSAVETKLFTRTRRHIISDDIPARSQVYIRKRQLLSLNNMENGATDFSQTKETGQQQGSMSFQPRKVRDERKPPKRTSELRQRYFTQGKSSKKFDYVHVREMINNNVGNAREDWVERETRLKQTPWVRTKVDSLSHHRVKRHKREANAESTTPSSDGALEGLPKGASATNEPETEFEMSWPEPEPDWLDAFEKWKVAWPLHTYGFAVTFAVLALLPLFEMLRMFLGKTRKSALKLSLLVMIFIFCATRAVALFVDPYGSARRLDLVTNQLLLSLGHPCIISALSLLLLVLIDTTRMNVAPPRFQRVKFIVPVLTLHITLVLVTDFVVAYFLEAKVLVLLCQIYFLVLGFLLTAGYIRVGWKIRMNAKANINSKNSSDNGMRRLQYLITACAASSAILSALTVYAAAGVFGIYSDVSSVEAWPWWIFQTSNRLLEILISTVILLMNIKTSSRRKIFPMDGWVSVFKNKRTTVLKTAATQNETVGCQQ